jgi:hypothetical protein
VERISSEHVDRCHHGCSDPESPCYKTDALPRIKQASESGILQNKFPNHDDGSGKLMRGTVISTDVAH